MAVFVAKTYSGGGIRHISLAVMLDRNVRKAYHCNENGETIFDWEAIEFVANTPLKDFPNSTTDNTREIYICKMLLAARDFHIKDTVKTS